MPLPGTTFSANRTEQTVVVPELSDETGSFTYALRDANGYKRVNSAGAATATIPPDSAVFFPPGATLTLEQTGAGQVTMTAGAGVTINSAGAKVATAAQFAVVSAIKTKVANIWTLFGNLA